VNLYIEVKGIVKIYRQGGDEVRVLDGIDLNVEKGGFIAIQGLSGCRKSTLLNIISCLEKPTSGQVIIEGSDVAQLDDDSLAEIRRKRIGFIFQRYNLIPMLNTIENAMLPMIFDGQDDKKFKDSIAKLLVDVSMDHRLNRKPAELSGGEQHVAIVRWL